ncbi:MAG: hypothetical protein WCY77_11745 [Weeksellaceae bacterium]
MLIRKANSSDSKFIAPLVIQAMEDMAKEFTQSDDLDKALDLFTHFISQKGNQYSYENTLIAIENGEVAGAISGYDGGKLKEFRKPFLDFLKMNFDYKEIPEGETPVIGDPLYVSITQEMQDPVGIPQGKYWITRIPTTLTILQDKSTGLEVTQPLPIFPEAEPENCENPEELETETVFKLDDVQLSASDRETTLPKSIIKP